VSLTVDIQCASTEPVPDEDDLRSWIAAAMASRGAGGDSEISLRLVDTEEMIRLNRAYRHRQGPTNVLSFPAELPPELGLPLLGDIVICAPVVRAEAAAQHKSLRAHWAHMAVHGTLHLLGYDHLEQEQATAMEALESAILAGLDFPCPYRAQPPQESSRHERR
jgi:probable rRNA maturation factor